MTGEKDYSGYVCRMLEMITVTNDFVTDMTWDEFAADQKTQFAVTYGLEVLAEAACSVPESVQVRYPDIPWDKMGKVRENLMTDCSTANTRYAWELLKDKLPRLKPAIESMLVECQRNE